MNDTFNSASDVQSSNNFYITFGQTSPAKNGWIRVVAADLMSARKIAMDTYKDKWSNIYPERDFEPELFPNGELGVLK